MVKIFVFHCLNTQQNKLFPTYFSPRPINNLETITSQLAKKCLGKYFHRSGLLAKTA